MTLRPLRDRVIVRRLEKDKKRAGGILIPNSAAKEPLRVVVVSAGPGHRGRDGQPQAPKAKAGDNVLTRAFAGTEVKVDGQGLGVLCHDDILAVAV